MYKSLISITCFVLILSVTSNALADLVAHYEFDETTGTIAADSSGNSNDGTLNGGPLWVAGKFGGALDFDGVNDYVAVSNTVPDDFTIMCWIKTNTPGRSAGTRTYEGSGLIWSDVSGAANDFIISIRGTKLWVSNQDYESGASVGDVVTGEWVHVAVTRVASTADVKIYINGELDKEVNLTIRASLNANPNVSIGGNTLNGYYYAGLIDDVRFYNSSLTEAEIQKAMIITPPSAASGPKPEDKSADIIRDVVIDWVPGIFADTHNLFFGTDSNDVNNATTTVPLSTIVAEGLDVNNYVPGRLEYATTYYWRVDEVNSPSNPGQYKGNVWQFTVEPLARKIPAENITASSLGAGVGSDPNQTINESGLDSANMDLHSKVAGNMWVSTGDVNDIWIRYDFDRVYKLDEMLVWNYNIQFTLKAGFKDVTVEYSEDGQTWTVLADVPEFAQGTGKERYLYNTVVDFNGIAAQSVRLTANSNWSDGTITKVGLSEVRFMYIPVWAREPYPEDEASDIPLDVTLSWRAGREAAEHKVYLSQDEQSVADGTAAVSTVSQPDRGPLSLDINRTYYWRVDEVNNSEIPSVWAGDIWSFSTPSTILIDGFEIGYDNTDANAVWNTWIDGYGNESVNGGLIGYEFPGPYLSTTNHSGGHSVPLRYDNTKAGYSEATAQVIDLPIGTTDWRTGNPDTLVIWFLGDVNNAFTDRLYAKLNSKKVVYNGAVTDINSPSWVKWKIDLSSFGISLNNVSSITIGVERVGTTGSSGILYIDDIGLTLEVESTDPGTANLTHSYTFENGTANDSVGSAHGTLVGGASIAGGALVTTAQDQWMTMPGSVLALNTYEEITIESWYTPASGANAGYTMLAYFGDIVGTVGANGYFITSARGNNVSRTAITIGNTTAPYNAESGVNGTEYDDGRLHHMVSTIDSTEIKFYIDGDFVGTAQLSAANKISGISPNYAYLAKGGYTADPEWIGKIHEFNIYNRALTTGEVFYLYKH